MSITTIPCTPGELHCNVTVEPAFTVRALWLIVGAVYFVLSAILDTVPTAVPAFFAVIVAFATAAVAVFSSPKKLNLNGAVICNSSPLADPANTA
jgi:hypothetical protein